MKLNKFLILFAFATISILFLISGGTAFAQEQGRVVISAQASVQSGTEVENLNGTVTAVLNVNSTDKEDLQQNMDQANPPPPPVAPFLNMGFLIEGSGDTYFRDTRPPKPQTTFTLQVEIRVAPNANVNSTLTWNLSGLPETYSAQLIDTQTSPPTTIDLRKASNYSWSAPPPSTSRMRVFSLIFSTSSLIPTPAPTPVVTPAPAPTTAPTPPLTPQPATPPPATPIAPGAGSPPTPPPAAKPAPGTSPAPAPAPGKPAPASPALIPPTATTATTSPPGGPEATPLSPTEQPEPTPFVFAPIETLPPETPLPAPRSEEEKSPIGGFIVVLFIVIAVVIAAAYMLFRLMRKPT